MMAKSYMAAEFSDLKGELLIDIDVTETEITFTTSEGVVYKMKHFQDCCESVYLEDFCGERDWLLNSPILVAEERSNSDDGKDDDDSFTWTFYEIATLKGSVTIRWYGSSNGYYSESVDFIRMESDKV